jgi:oligopeptide transport system substrate-binding protein
MWKISKMKWSSILSAVLTMALVGTLLAACTSGNNNNGGQNQNGGETAPPSGNSPSTNTQTGDESNAEPTGGLKEFRFTISSEPPSLDPALSTDSQSYILGLGLYEGLFRLNPEGISEPALAESIVVSADGKTYTFKLHQGAKWTNGDPVTAHDFEYSWKRTLAPETAADYAYMLYYLENGEKYNAGEASADEVGVKALDDYTLEVKLESATPYFLDILAHSSYWPVNKNVVEGRPDWATDIKTLVTNGPFKVTEWQHGGKLVLEKNPDYYNKDKINFDKVTVLMVEEDSTVFNLFKTDQIDWIGAQAGSVPTDQVTQVLQSGEAKVMPIASTYYYIFNTTKKPFSNAKIRKAFAMAIDRQAIIDNVTKANQEPAFALVPPSIRGVEGKSFRELYPDSGYFQENVEEAKKLLAEGLQEEGLSKFPEVTLLYNTNEGHKAIAEAIVDQWRKNLGVEVKLGNQEWGTFLETRDALQYDIARAGWGADYNHPISFSYDLIHSKSGNNDGAYANPQVDQLLEQAIASSDEKTVMANIAEAEKIAIADDMAILPIYYYTTVTMMKPGIVDVVSDYAGYLNWVFGDRQ